jgi:hypothetical protein
MAILKQNLVFDSGAVLNIKIIAKNKEFKNWIDA